MLYDISRGGFFVMVLLTHVSTTAAALARYSVECRLATIFRHFNPLNAELNPIYHLLALLGVHHFLHVSRIRVKSLILRLLILYIYGAPILDICLL